MEDKFSNKRSAATVLIHIVVWAVIFLFPYIFNGIYNEKPNLPAHSDAVSFQYLETATNLLWVGLFYLNAEWIVPRFFYRKGYVLFIFCIVLSFPFIMLLHALLFHLFVPFHEFKILRSSGHNLAAFLFTVTISTTYKLMSDKTRNDAKASELQKENLKTELSFLRSQISPHFLFNVLNNIVAMVRLKSEELEPTVIKLSSLLQYMLYETDDEKVLLSNESEYLQNYIELQRLRFNSKLILKSEFNIHEKWQAIEPMLLIPFVENAFKHCHSGTRNSEIDIRLDVKNDFLDFWVRNTFDEGNNEDAKDKTSGIGLANVKRRLKLLYSENHTLEIDRANGWYSIHLKLHLK